MMRRLPALRGEWLDRSRPLDFRFEGGHYRGYHGDTISSALAAAGVMTVGRSFKYHRRRGLLSAANHDSNAIFQLGNRPSVRGDATPLAAGMDLSAVNTFGGLEHDRAAIIDRLAPFLPVGFYYKAFHGKRLAARWERMFRQLTGLGRLALDAPREPTAKRYAFCDVLVIGGGPSGLSAALAAADADARVLLADEAARLGGSGPAGQALDPERAGTLQALIERVMAEPRIEVLCGTYAAGYYDDHWVALAEPHRLSKVRARSVVLASGAIEQPTVFRNNDLPGILLASGAQRLLHRHAVAPGADTCVVAANDQGYEAALDLRAQGVAVRTLVDLRADAAPELRARLKALNIEVLAGWAPYEAHAGKGGALAALSVAPVGAAAGAVEIARLRRLNCDALLLSTGWAPALQLAAQAGARVLFDEARQQHRATDLPPGLFVAGRAAGEFEFGARLADGRRAGAAAAAVAVGTTAAHRSVVPTPAPTPTPAPGAAATHAFAIFDHPRGKNFVDFDEDLQVKDLENAAQEGFDSVELMKRFSTVGMGPSQGKHSNVNAVRVLARKRNVSIAELGLTTARPMYHPVPIKLLAGRSFNAERKTPLDARHAALGAVWMPAANWRRPEYYARAGLSRRQCIDEEVRAVRERIGLIDVGTLGKIEVYGPEAGLFLDRVYAGRFSDLKIGMTRYGLMLDESATIIDDGVVARLGEQHYYFTTTTGGSATVFRELLRWNALWGLQCALVNVTGHRAACNVAGPLCRDLLRTLTDLDLSDAAFPYLAVREARIAGIPARLMRVGFVGEVGYEVHVPWDGAVQVWDAIAAAGRARDLRAFGVEAQRVLRLEKGHLIVSQDTDGLTNPIEAAAMWAVRMAKPFFIGQRSLRILQARGPRQLLVGLEIAGDGRAQESHLVIDNGEIAGRLTSVARSVALGRTIALAMLRPDLAVAGRAVTIRGTGGAMIQAQVVPTPFYDPAGLRQKPGAGT
jgi:sarcosine oxidase subunit alpha